METREVKRKTLRKAILKEHKLLKNHTYRVEVRKVKNKNIEKNIERAKQRFGDKVNEINIYRNIDNENGFIIISYYCKKDIDRTRVLEIQVIGESKVNIS